MVQRFNFTLIIILTAAFMVALIYFLFFHVYVREIYGDGVVFVNGRPLSSNSTLTFKLTRYGFLGGFQPLNLRIEAKPSEGWMVDEIRFNGEVCSGGVIEVWGDGVVEVVFISYPSALKPIAFLDLAGDGSYDFILDVNQWNLRSARGYANMTYNVNRRILYYDQCL